MAQEVWRSAHITCKGSAISSQTEGQDAIVPTACEFQADGEISELGRVHPTLEDTLLDHFDITAQGTYGHSSMKVTKDGQVIGIIHIDPDHARFIASSVR